MMCFIICVALYIVFLPCNAFFAPERGTFFYHMPGLKRAGLVTCEMTSDIGWRKTIKTKAVTNHNGERGLLFVNLNREDTGLYVCGARLQYKFYLWVGRSTITLDNSDAAVVGLTVVDLYKNQTCHMYTSNNLRFYDSYELRTQGEKGERVVGVITNMPYMQLLSPIPDPIVYEVSITVHSQSVECAAEAGALTVRWTSPNGSISRGPVLRPEAPGLHVCTVEGVYGTLYGYYYISHMRPNATTNTPVDAWYEQLHGARCPGIGLIADYVAAIALLFAAACVAFKGGSVSCKHAGRTTEEGSQRLLEVYRQGDSGEDIIGGQ
ncbi:ORF114 [Ranid herpesvirus 1]|uniref:ORF114 n=1 Tax=Ranid herpesvirus 1 TaxID=85655 RepID=Q14VL6_9VIRU|nr:ORF114 [Ranid herpesvirus 1]ABG25757.1 ORF114 [Ranid herpesvirus 1]